MYKETDKHDKKLMTGLCTICKAGFNVTGNTVEHIVLSALGGKKTSNKYLCSSCNNKAGSTVDKDLSEEIAFLRNTLNLKNGKGKKPPKIKVDLKSGRKLELRPGGIPFDNSFKFQVEDIENGRKKIDIEINGLDHLASKIDDIANRLSITPEQMIAKIAETGLNVEVRKINEILPQQLSLGKESHYASALKSSLVLWAEITNGEEVCSNKLSAAQSWVLNCINKKIEKPDFYRGDARALRRELLPKGNWGEIYNLLYIFSDSQGMIYSVLRILDTFNFYFKIGTTEKFKNRGGFIIINPETGQNLMKFELLEIKSNDIWPEKLSDKDFELSATNAMRKLLQYSYKKNDQAYVEQLIDDAIFECFPNDGEIISKEALTKLGHDVSEAILMHRLGHNRQKNYDKETALKVLNHLYREHKKLN